jgi:hypothetical protein
VVQCGCGAGEGAAACDLSKNREALHVDQQFS